MKDFLKNRKYRPIDLDEYQKHHLFSELEYYVEFYDDLSMSASHFLSMGTNLALSIDNYFFSSIAGTIESIVSVLKNGRINDAYALLRKYYDSAVINIYSIVFIEDHIDCDNFHVKKINDWIDGTEQFPKFGVMANYILDSKKLSKINDLLHHFDHRYEGIRSRCNDNIHYNYFFNVLLNDNEAYNENRVKLLNMYLNDIRDILILHISYLFILKEHFFSASDYFDALELGLKPEPNSQYWIAPYIQKLFNDVITKRRPDITKAIQRSTCMNLL